MFKIFYLALPMSTTRHAPEATRVVAIHRRSLGSGITSTCDAVNLTVLLWSLNMTLSHTLRSQLGLIPLKSLATLLGVHYQTIYGWVSLGQVPHVRLGSRIKFDGVKVAEWLEQRSVG